MAKDRIEKHGKTVNKPEKRDDSQKRRRRESPTREPAGMAGLQQRIGNRAVQRLIAQRSGDSGFDLDDETAARIGRERGSGQPLDRAAGEKLGAAMGADFDDVRVHTTPAADALTRDLGARAFTTGQDIFFREGTYAPHSADGESLLAHELAHVVQQGAGQVPESSGMTVNAPGDAFEQAADRVAEQATAGGAEAVAQRQEEEEEEVQMQEEEEEVQLQIEEEEEELQMQEEEEEEALQMQEVPEEEMEV